MKHFQLLTTDPEALEDAGLHKAAGIKDFGLYRKFDERGFAQNVYVFFVEANCNKGRVTIAFFDKDDAMRPINSKRNMETTFLEEEQAKIIKGLAEAGIIGEEIE